MTRRLAVALLALAGAGCVLWPAGSGPGNGPIALGEALAAVASGRAVILDVRPREGYEAGHIPGALHFDALELEARVAQIRRLERLPILYCG